MMYNTARIVIADDHAMVRDGLRTWIEKEREFSVIAEAATSRECITICEFERPDILLQDIQMPDKSGLEVIRHLRKATPDLRILALSGLDRHYAMAAIHAGANGFVCKEERKSVILDALHWAAEKTAGTWLSPLAAQATFSSQEEIRKHHLTETEQEIVKHLKSTNRVIADTLFISEGTVKNHISSIYSKLGLATRQQAIAWAEQHGFLDSPAK